MNPKRIQLSRAKGWRKPEGSIVVARPSRWGNPYRADVFGLDRCLALYRESLGGGWNPRHARNLPDELAHKAYILHREFIKRFGTTIPAEEARYELRGHDLCCWCELSAACHGDILLEVANMEVR